jgi:hypothetical protein
MKRWRIVLDCLVLAAAVLVAAITLLWGLE